MITYSHYRSGKIFGMRYVFESGNALPVHAHKPEELHNVIVLKGRCRFSSVEQSRTLEAGEVFDFDGSIEHLIVALEPCELLSLFLNGEPENYKNLSESDRSGVI